MVKGSLGDDLRCPRLLCQLAMEEFVEYVLDDDLYDLSAWAVEVQSFGGGDFSDLCFRLGHQEFLEMMRDFGDIFQEGLSIHKRSLRIRSPSPFRDTDRCPPAPSYKQSQCALPGIGIIWTSSQLCCFMGACHDETS